MTFTSHKQLISSILKLPDAPFLVQNLQETLKKESKKRLAFYNQITEQEKAEFINGEVIIHSPVMKRHHDVGYTLSRIMEEFIIQNDLGFMGFEKIMIALTRNDYEPDICYFKPEKAKKFKSDQVLFPAPDLIVEILSKSTAKNDRGIKFQDYELHGVSEYWIIDSKNKSLEQYCLSSNKKYKLNLKAKSGEIESQAIKGFRIPIEAIFDKKMASQIIKSF